MRKGIYLGTTFAMAVALIAMALVFSTAAMADVCPCPTAFQGDEGGWGSGSYLGVDTRDVTTDRMAPLKLKDESGVEITMVDQDAPAGKAGLKEKDVILTFNGQKVEGVEQLRRMIHEVPPGRQASLGISRDGQLMNVPVTLGDRKLAMKNNIRKRMVIAGPNSMPAMPSFPSMDMDIPSVNVFMTAARGGVMVETLTPQLADFFGVKGGGGVLIRSVDKGSAAESAGLKAGDVIVRVDKENISDVGDWRRITRARAGTASVVVVRDKREVNLNMKFPERKSRDNSFNNGSSDFDFDFDFDLDDVQANVKNIVPTIAEQQRIARLAMNEVERQRPQIERAIRESVNAQKIQKEAQAAIDKAMKEQKKAFEHMQKDLENQKLDKD